MNRLWIRLTLAFGLVTVVAVAIAAFLANQQVSANFRRYIVHNQMMESTLIPSLIDYYAANGAWEGVETILDNAHGMGQGQGKGQGTGQGRRQGAPKLLLADTNRRIIYDETGERSGDKLSGEDVANIVPVEWQGQAVGYLVASAPANQTGLTESAQAFLNQINRSLIQAGLIAGVLGMLLGLVIARGVSAPLGQLAQAARRISQGQLSQRVPEKGADEMADVAHAFNEMAASLEQADALRRNMVADIAHELRTPLSVVQGNLRAILDDVYPLDKEEISSIYDETLILNRLISDLRELAQAEAGQLSLNIAPAPLSPLITGVTERFQELAREKKITLSAGIPDALPLVLADADRVRQVLHNFISNALRHTPNGGQIKIIAAQENLDGHVVKVSIADTGPGIAPRDLPHVFDRFWRADKSRAREQGGSGLGLAIAHQIIKAHNGQVGVESQVNQGSCFWFVLPVVETGNIQ